MAGITPSYFTAIAAATTRVSKGGLLAYRKRLESSFDLLPPDWRFSVCWVFPSDYAPTPGLLITTLESPVPKESKKLGECSRGPRKPSGFYLYQVNRKDKYGWIDHEVYLSLGYLVGVGSNKSPALFGVFDDERTKPCLTA